MVHTRPTRRKTNGVESRRAARRAESGGRRRAEETSRPSSADLEAKFDSAPHGEALLDRELRYTHVNRFFAELGGVPPAEYVGKRPREVAPEFGVRLESALRSVVKTGHAVVGWEDTLVTRSGRTMHVLANFQPMRPTPRGRVVAVGATIFDVTGLWRAEHERADVLVREQAAHAASEHANRMKDEFLARVSHELRTPLSSMLMWLHLLRVGGAKGRAAAFDALEQSAHAQLQVIDDLLDVARGLSGKLRINRDVFEPGPVVMAAIHALGPTAMSKSVRVVSAVTTDVGSIVGDAGRLGQIVTNLVANAIKFTPAGGTVAVDLEREGDEVHLTVRDSGSGMSAAFLPRAFAAFSQADGSGTRSHDGLGLGLAIVRQLVELHGGTVRAESAGEGQGALFTVTLPAKPIVVRPAERKALGATATKLAGVKVLVVEDDDLARDGLALVLEGYGATVATAASVSEAVAELGRAWPDVLLTDIAMPREDGYALIRKVKSLELERGQPLPSAALTAYASPEDHARVLDAGFQAFVAKPVHPAALLAVVLRLAGRAP